MYIKLKNNFTNKIMTVLIIITLNIKKWLLTSENSGDSDKNKIDNCCDNKEIRIIKIAKIKITIVQEYSSYNKMNKYHNNWDISYD